MKNPFKEKSGKYLPATVIKYIGDNLYLVSYDDGTTEQVYSKELWKDTETVTVHNGQILAKALKRQLPRTVKV